MYLISDSFNILIDVIAKVKNRGVIKTIYANVIAFQVRDERHRQLVINMFTMTCNSVGLIISPSKTKVLTTMKDPLNSFKIQGTALTTETHWKPGSLTSHLSKTAVYYDDKFSHQLSLKQPN